MTERGVYRYSAEVREQGVVLDCALSNLHTLADGGVFMSELPQLVEILRRATAAAEFMMENS